MKQALTTSHPLVCTTAGEGFVLSSYGVESVSTPSQIAAYIDEEANLAPIEIGWGIPDSMQVTGAITHTLRVEYLQHGRSDRIKEMVQTSNSPIVKFDLGLNFIGGTYYVTVDMPVINNGAPGRATGKAFADIGGKNPSHDRVRREISDISLQVIAFKESRFRQFGADHYPLFGEPRGFGLMQLDPPPDRYTVWSWKRNLKAAKALFEQKKKDAAAYEKKNRKQYKDAPAWSSEQMLLEIFHRYNGGSHWSWDTSAKAWVANPGNGYADDCLRIQRLVESGRPPSEW